MECSKRPGECHYERAQLILKGDTDALSDCNRKSAATFEGLTQDERLKRSLTELDIAISAEDIVPAKKVAAQFDKAAVLITLGSKQLILGDTEGAERNFNESASVYVSLLKSGPDSQLSQVAVGLLRCGRPVQAFQAINRLPLHGVEREYLIAESMMAIGQRKAGGYCI